MTGTNDTAATLAGLPCRYTIEREIGRGEASILWLGHERPPDRQVVVKVLDTRRCGERDRLRFRREVEIASELRHPAIVPIFAAGETACKNAAGEPCPYYVMPYIPGESLRGRLTREGQLSITTTVAIARDVGEALDHAHRQGIVHRDVKPDNVLLDEAHAFLTDFGIARPIAHARITREGTTVGTAPYMSPEAVVDHPLTGAADIYSLACMTYEMLTGLVPFGGLRASQVMRRQVRDPPPSLAPVRPDLPPAVARVLQRGLAKRAADRPATAREFVRELALAANLAWMVDSHPGVTPTTLTRLLSVARRRPALAALASATPVVAIVAWLVLRPPPPPPAAPVATYTDSVAVLIPHNLTGRPELDILGELLADAVHHQLARYPDLRITSLQSAFAVQHSSLRIRQLADTLGVGHLLEATVRLHADTVVFHYTMWDAAETPVLIGDARVPLARAPGATEAVAQGIARRLLDRYPRLSTPRAGTPGDHGPGWAAYARGRTLLQRRGPYDLRDAIASLETAIARDPGNAAAHAALSVALTLSVIYQYGPADDGYATIAQARAHAEHALALDPQLAAGYSARGLLTSRAWGPLARARHDFAQARQLEPNETESHSWNAILLGEQGRHDEALAAAEQAVRLDPLSPGPRIALLIEALAARRYERVIREAERTERLAPDVPLAHTITALAHLLAGEPTRCLRLNLGPYGAVHAMCLAAAGHPAEATRAVDSIARGVESGGFGDRVYGDALRASSLAAYHAWRGDAAAALVWTRRAFALSPVGIDRRVLHSALFDRVRGDSAFAAELERITGGVWMRVEGR